MEKLVQKLKIYVLFNKTYVLTVLLAYLTVRMQLYSGTSLIQTFSIWHLRVLESIGKKFEVWIDKSTISAL